LEMMIEIFSILPSSVMTHRPSGRSCPQMQPRGFGMPAIFAASLAGPLGKSS
jgi:hypothetical protein